MRYFILLLTFGLIGDAVYAQTYPWNSTPSPIVSYRYEDVYFLNPDTGFAVHYSGAIIRTDNGGASWTTVLDSVPFTYRDIGFTDDLHGWIGTYQNTGAGADTSIMYATVDGGWTWNPVTNLPGPQNAGICGMNVINDSTIVGVGRYSGPTGFYKTTNNGITWSYTDLSALADGLVDVYFVDEDTGFAVGNTGPSFSTGYGRILYTTDGGLNWAVLFTSAYQYSLCWKISFPSRNVGYISMQMWNSAIRRFLKTTDGGMTWTEMTYPGGPSSSYNIEGIGFINDSTGWVGGGYPSYFTSNGGSNWSVYPALVNVNRFRFLSDSLAYCAGYCIYKMDFNVAVADHQTADGFKNYPNPCADNQYIEFYTYAGGEVHLSVLDMQGREVRVLINEDRPQGNQHFIWSAEGLPAGTYFYKLICDGKVMNEQFIIAR